MQPLYTAKETILISKLVLVAVMLSAFAFMGPISASAAGPYDPDSLGALLLTGDDMGSVAAAVNDTRSLAGTQDEPSASDPVISVGRDFLASDGSVAVTLLYSLPDGSAPTARNKSDIQDGTLVKAYAQGEFSKVSGVTKGGSAVGDGQDQLFSFVGTAKDGTNYNIVADAYWRGNIIGVVLYGTPGDNDGYFLGAVLGFQTSKLP